MTATSAIGLAFRAGILTVSLASFAGLAFAGGEVTECGQVLVGENYLTADLDCSAATGVTLTLRAGATLELRGFTITGAAPVGSQSTIACLHRCTVVGPGTVIANTDDMFSAVVGPAGNWVEARVVVDGATLRNGGVGVSAPRVTVRNATIADNLGTGIWTGVSKIVGSTITGNGLSPDSIVPFGVFGQVKTRIEDSTITGNAVVGVQANKIVLVGSTLADNDAAASCGTSACGDILSSNRPRLVDTSCEHSLVAGSSPPVSWQVCSAD